MDKKIHILIPTVRPGAFITCSGDWMAKAFVPDLIGVKTVVDKQGDYDLLHNAGYDALLIDNPRKGVCYPLDKLIRALDYQDDDIILVLNDDMWGFQNWDVYFAHFLYDEMNNKQGVCLKINDGVQGDGVITIPVMTGACLRRLNGYVFHPAYYHNWSDIELWHNVVDLGMLKRCPPEIIIEHRHCGNGQRSYDEADRIRDSHNLEDQYMWQKIRSQMTVEERIE